MGIFSHALQNAIGNWKVLLWVKRVKYNSFLFSSLLSYGNALWERAQTGTKHQLATITPPPPLLASVARSWGGHPRVIRRSGRSLRNASSNAKVVTAQKDPLGWRGRDKGETLASPMPAAEDEVHNIVGIIHNLGLPSNGMRLLHRSLSSTASLYKHHLLVPCNMTMPLTNYLFSLFCVHKYATQ